VSNKIQRLDVEGNEGLFSEIQHDLSFHKETSEKKKRDFVEDLPELQLVSYHTLLETLKLFRVRYSRS